MRRKQQQQQQQQQQRAWPVHQIKLGSACLTLVALPQNLSPAQEAYLDVQSHPWWPDFWYMSGLLADSSSSNGASSSGTSSASGRQRQQQQQSQQQQPATVPSASTSTASSFDMLCTPITAYGAGLRFKRESCLVSTGL